MFIMQYPVTLSLCAFSIDKSFALLLHILPSSFRMCMQIRMLYSQYFSLLLTVVPFVASPCTVLNYFCLTEGVRAHQEACAYACN